MNSPRFGLCTNAPPGAATGATELYLWIDHRLLEALDAETLGSDPVPAIWNWRKDDPKQKFYRIPTPLYSKASGEDRYAELTDVPYAAGGPDLKSLLPKLGEELRAPSAGAVNRVRQYANDLEFAQGYYTPAAIGNFNATVRR